MVELAIVRDPTLQPVVEVARHVEAVALPAIPLCAAVVLIPARAHAHLALDHALKHLTRNGNQEY